MEIPSYVVSGFDDETLRLAQELDGLGGGDAKIFNAEVHCIVAGSNDTIHSTDQVLWVKDNRVGVRNTSLSKTEPIARSTRYFTFNSVTKINEVIDNPNSFPLIENLKNHLIDGFNGTLIALGEKGVGKTRTLFGASPPLQSSDIPRNLDIPSSLVTSLLQKLYSHKDTSNEAVTIALSIWVIRGVQIIDLLSPSSSESLLDLAVIECPDLKTAMQVISSARDKMPGVLCNPREPLEDCQNEPMHFLLRIILHTAPFNDISNKNITIKMNTEKYIKKSKFDSGRLSVLTIVDLVGKLTDNDIAAPSTDDMRVLRRRTNIGLAALSRVINLIKKAHKTTNGIINNNPLFPARSNITLTPARESTLTSVLTPMLVGNTKLFFMPFIRDGINHSVSTNDTLLLVHGMNGIMSAAFRLNRVSLAALRMKPATHCLGPFVVNPFNPICNTKTNATKNDKIRDTDSYDGNEIKAIMTKTSKLITKINDNNYDHTFSDITDNFTTLFEQTKNVSAINKAIIDKINDVSSCVSNTKTNIDDDNDDNDITFSSITNINTTQNRNQIRSSTNKSNDVKLNSTYDAKSDKKSSAASSKIITDISNPRKSYLNNYNKKNRF